MPISPAQFNAVPITQNNDIVIEMLAERPTNGTTSLISRTPGQLCGYYNAISNYVELYVVSASGIKFVRVG